MMTDTSAPIRIETPVEPSPALRAPSPSDSGASSDPVSGQLHRIEEKTARIEEKYARSEALILRVGDKVEAATGRMSEAARQADLIMLKNEVTGLAQRVNRLPGIAMLGFMMILTVVLTSAATVLLLQNGIPGVLPR